MSSKSEKNFSLFKEPIDNPSVYVSEANFIQATPFFWVLWIYLCSVKLALTC